MLTKTMTFSALALVLAACNGGVGAPGPADDPMVAPGAEAPAPAGGAEPIGTPEPLPDSARGGTEVAAAPLEGEPAEPAQPRTVAEPLPFIGDGYPQPGDECRRLGENEYTAEFLDHTADLVACPEDYAGLDEFVMNTNAAMLDRTQGHVVLSVPTEG